MGIKQSSHYLEDDGSYSTKKPKKEKRKTKILIGIPTSEKVKRGRYYYYSSVFGTDHIL